MTGLIEGASAILRASSLRLENSAQNIANVATAGYKRRLSASRGGDGYADVALRTVQDMAAGKLQQTGANLDLAITGEGWFQLRDDDAVSYTRQGNFRLMPDGTVATARGGVLQQAGGGDLVLTGEQVRILADGTVFDGDVAVGRVGVFTAPSRAFAAIDGAAFRLSGENAVAVDDPQIRQGMIEASNVSLGDEMLTMMAALRQAESGARLVQTWDDLVGRAISSFGQGAGR